MCACERYLLPSVALSRNRVFSWNFISRARECTKLRLQANRSACRPSAAPAAPGAPAGPRLPRQLPATTSHEQPTCRFNAPRTCMHAGHVIPWQSLQGRSGRGSPQRRSGCALVQLGSIIQNAFQRSNQYAPLIATASPRKAVMRALSSWRYSARLCDVMAACLPDHRRKLDTVRQQ